MWIDKPETEWVSDIMKSTRSQYHYLVRRFKRSRDLQIRDALGRALLTYSNRDYWSETSKVRGKGRSNSSVVNGYSYKDISNEFANNYNIFDNSVNSDLTGLQSMDSTIIVWVRYIIRQSYV